MSVITAGESMEIIPVECWECEGEYFIAMDDRGDLSACPYCGSTSGQGIQGRTLEVSA